MVKLIIYAQMEHWPFSGLVTNIDMKLQMETRIGEQIATKWKFHGIFVHETKTYMPVTAFSKFFIDTINVPYVWSRQAEWVT